MEIGIDWPNDQQLLKAWSIMDALKPGQVAVVKDYAKANPKLFIQAVKMYADCFGRIEFNKDYTKVKRLNRID